MTDNLPALISEAQRQANWTRDRNNYHGRVAVALTANDPNAANIWLALRLAIRARDIDRANAILDQIEYGAQHRAGIDLDADRRMALMER